MSQQDTSVVTKMFGSFSLIQIIATSLVIYYLSKSIRRIYFHPLSKFPGPKSRIITRIPAHIETWKGGRHRGLVELHRKYGPVVRVNHDELSFTDPDAWKDIYGHGTKGTKGSSPHKAWNLYGAGINGSRNLLQAYDADHSRQRKIFTPAFSDRALKEQEPLFIKYIDQLVAKIKENIAQNPGASIDMVQKFNFTTFDIMSDLTFGEPLHMLEKDTWDPWVSIIFRSIKVSARLSFLTFYPLFWRPFKYFLPTTINKKRLEHFDNSVRRVTKRLEKGRESEGVDLWDLVLRQTEGKGLTRAEMDVNASLFMLAGTETTATLLSGMTYLLLQNPDCMKRLVGEIRSAFNSADDMTMESIAAIPYLTACLKEALRLYPPVPLGLPRRTPADGSTVCGHFVPPNTTLIIPQYAMYTSARNFKQPLDFIPERWMGDSRFDGDARHAVQPFSVGSRDCLGKNLAYHEMRLVAAKVLYTFDFQLSPESSDWNKQNTFILWEKMPLMCKLTVAR